MDPVSLINRIFTLASDLSVSEHPYHNYRVSAVISLSNNSFIIRTTEFSTFAYAHVYIVEWFQETLILVVIIMSCCYYVSCFYCCYCCYCIDIVLYVTWLLLALVSILVQAVLEILRRRAFKRRRADAVTYNSYYEDSRTGKEYRAFPTASLFTQLRNSLHLRKQRNTIHVAMYVCLMG